MAVLRPLAGYVGLLCAAWAGCAAAAPSTGSTRADRLAEISHYRDQAQWVDALAAIQRAQLHEPDDDLLYKLQVLTLGDIGNAALAWRLYQARPQLFDSAQRDRLQANVLARQVGWSLAYGETEDTRLDEAESALQQLDQHAQAQGGASTRLRLDRLIVLNRLGLHAQVRDEARALQAQGVELPDYVLPVVADSMMATRHPDEALPLLQRAVRNDPSRLQARTELAYALLESEHAGQAIGYLQAWQQEEPAWRWGGGKAPYANWARYEADLNLAMVRAYSNDLPQAQQALEAMAAIGPGNSGLQSSLGSVYQMRGWPRRALQRHQIAHTLDPRNVPPRIGMVESWVQLQRDDLARPVHDDLLARYPNQPSVQRMDRDWRAHRGWQLQAGIEGGRSAGGGGSSPLGNDDLRWSLEAASPVLDDRWRLFAGAQRQSITFQSQDIAPLWLVGGVRYRFDRLDAEAALLHANDAVGRTGLRSSIGWQFNDRWHVGLSAAGNDPDASMQARIAGITADSIAIAADYQRNERTAWHLSVSQYRYDDGNRREAISSSLQQRLLSRPTLLIDGLASVYASRGSRDDAPYFNPSRDHSLELGLRIDQQVWQHYERHFRHRLEISLGDYWQQGHGDALVPRVAYRHEWQRAQGRVFEYGVSWSRPVYDGQRERHIGFDAAWRWGNDMQILLLRLGTWLGLAIGLMLLPLASQASAPLQPDAADNGLLVLSYHDIRDDVREKSDADAFAVSTQNFAAHLDWLSSHGYHPVSLQQVIQASRGQATLPPRPVLLTFDDGLRSVYTRAYPLLRAYNYPALVAVITDYVDMAPGRSIDYGYRPFGHDDFLTWAQLREMQASGLIEVASHTDDLHHGLQSNPQGNQTPAAITRAYDPQRQRYETAAEYEQRLRADLGRSVQRIERELGVRPRAIVWPYAAYNQLSNQIADQLGMRVSFDLEGRSTPVTADLHGLARLLVTNNPNVTALTYELRRDMNLEGTRALQVDLDALYDANPAQQARNLDALIERVRRIGPTHVYLQAFADPDGNNTADALYFPNRHLPMRADLFNRVAWQLRTRAGVKVFAWLPVLGYELPDPAQRAALGIASPEHDGMYRLDFTQPQARQIVRDIYEDLAINSYIEGLLFHDDAYVRDTELPQLPPEEQDGARTRALIDFTLELRDSAQRWRPKLATVRNLYAQPVLRPQSAAWFAQRLDLFNQAYDHTALMAMPWMEGSAHPERWLDRLVEAVRSHDPDLRHTLFELQTMDWRTRQPIPAARLHEQILRLQAQGVRHLAWYPDDFIGDRPSTPQARAAMSARDFPYPEK